MRHKVRREAGEEGVEKVVGAAFEYDAVEAVDDYMVGAQHILVVRERNIFVLEWHWRSSLATLGCARALNRLEENLKVLGEIWKKLVEAEGVLAEELEDDMEDLV